MAAYINQVYLLGNLGQDPTFQTTNFGEMATFTLATSTFYRDRNTNDWITNTEWHRIVVFNEKLVNIVKHFKKGSKVLVRGMLKSRKYTDKTGIERTSIDIQADEVQLITKIETENSYTNNQYNNTNSNFSGNNFNNGFPNNSGNSMNNTGFGSSQGNGFNSSMNNGFGNNSGSGFPQNQNSNFGQNAFSQNGFNQDSSSFGNSGFNNSGSGFGSQANNPFNTHNEFKGAFAKPAEEKKQEKKSEPAESISDNDLPF